MATKTKPRLAVFKFASCDGCQLTLLNLEDELLAIAGEVEIAYFPEATSTMLPGRYDIALVEGSIITDHDLKRLREIRAECDVLIAIGSCSTTGGIQALRNWANIDEYVKGVYASPQFIHTLAKSTPISDHVKVDFALHGCPINRGQLLSMLTSLCIGRPPEVPAYSLCMECKRNGNVCVTVAQGTPCLGPVTRAGCGALCPSCDRGCFGCFGPMESANPDPLVENLLDRGIDRGRLQRLLGGFTANTEVFRTAVEKLEAHK